MATLLTSPAPQRRPLRWVLGGCALLAVCGMVFSAVAAGWWLFFRNSTTKASQPAVEYLVDASARMALASAGGGSDRLTAARSVLAEIIRPASVEVRAGLRVFGTGVVLDACEDSDLVVPLGPANQPQIADRLSAVNTGPSDEAALAKAMVQAIRDLSALPGPYTLVVVTGGSNSCYPEAGQLISNEAKQAGVELEYFVIGFEVLPDEGEALKGMVDLLGTGNYLPARDRDELRTILKAIQAHIEAPNAQTISDVLATAQANSNATATAQASSTAPATATVTPEAQGTATVQLPTPTATAASDATATAAATGASSYAAQTACDHPYLPLRPDATWTYSSSPSTWTINVADVSGNLDTATATLTRRGATTDTTTWQCGPDGIAPNDMFGGLLGTAVQRLMGAGFPYELTQSSGAWLLPVSQLKPGARWSYRRTVESREATGLKPLWIWAYEEELTVIGVETIALAGDTLQALRVDSTFTITEHGSLMVSGRERYWFVQSVGLVRMQKDIIGANSSTFDLQSYRVP